MPGGAGAEHSPLVGLDSGSLQATARLNGVPEALLTKERLTITRKRRLRMGWVERRSISEAGTVSSSRQPAQMRVWDATRKGADLYGNGSIRSTGSSSLAFAQAAHSSSWCSPAHSVTRVNALAGS